MSTPAERLCSRSWRLRNSLWLAPAVLLLGLATWASFLYIGIKAKNRTWLVSAGFYGAAAVVGGALISAYTDEAKETSTVGENVGAAVVILAWIFGIVQGFIANRQWLVWKSHADDAGPWYSEHQTGRMDQGGFGAVPAPTPDDLLRGRAHVVSTGSSSPGPPLPPPPPPPPSIGGLIDLNTASAADLATQLGLAEGMASAVVAGRDRIGGFTTPDQLMTVGGVPPHVYAGIRDRVVVHGSAAVEDQPPTRGRRLEF